MEDPPTKTAKAFLVFDFLKIFEENNFHILKIER